MNTFYLLFLLFKIFNFLKCELPLNIGVISEYNNWINNDDYPSEDDLSEMHRSSWDVYSNI